MRPLHHGNEWNNVTIEKTRIYGSLPSTFFGGDTIAIFPDSIEIYNKKDSTENGEVTDYIFDKYIATGYRQELNGNHFNIDSGNEYTITSVCFTSYFEAGLKKEVSFKLFYWNNEWKSFGKQNGSDKHVIFKVCLKVPYSC